mmetsp:Transcript_27059/g.68197  ORF Transcript_27059/g.68197 Transcript_27059/m.68197 type:complete len:231 (+) Transcript_27059:248-940(+)
MTQTTHHNVQRYSQTNNTGHNGQQKRPQWVEHRKGCNKETDKKTAMGHSTIKRKFSRHPYAVGPTDRSSPGDSSQNFLPTVRRVLEELLDRQTARTLRQLGRRRPEVVRIVNLDLRVPHRRLPTGFPDLTTIAASQHNRDPISPKAQELFPQQVVHEQLLGTPAADPLAAPDHQLHPFQLEILIQGENSSPCCFLRHRALLGRLFPHRRAGADHAGRYFQPAAKHSPPRV